MSIVVSHARVDQIESGGGPGTAKLTVWILAVLGWDFDVSSTIFVEMVCKVQLNIVFNGCQTSKGTEMEIHVSLASRARSGQVTRVARDQSLTQTPRLAQP